MYPVYKDLIVVCLPAGQGYVHLGSMSCTWMYEIRMTRVPSNQQEELQDMTHPIVAAY